VVLNKNLWMSWCYLFHRSGKIFLNMTPEQNWGKTNDTRTESRKDNRIWKQYFVWIWECVNSWWTEEKRGMMDRWNHSQCITKFVVSLYMFINIYISTLPIVTQILFPKAWQFKRPPMSEEKQTSTFLNSINFDLPTSTWIYLVFEYSHSHNYLCQCTYPKINPDSFL
jgi:hypothetical protein